MVYDEDPDLRLVLFDPAAPPPGVQDSFERHISPERERLASEGGTDAASAETCGADGRSWRGWARGDHQPSRCSRAVQRS